MKKGDKYLSPVINFTDTKVNIEAIADPQEGMFAIQSDSPYEMGYYINGGWEWGGGGGVGTGTAGQLIKWGAAGDTLVDAALIPPATNILTLTATAASTLGLAITAGKTLTLTATDNFNLTIPATGVVGLLATAQTWTGANKIDVNSITALFVEQDGVKNNVFIVDTTNGRVGINTVSGESALQVKGTGERIFTYNLLAGTEFWTCDSSGTQVVTGTRVYYKNASLTILMAIIPANNQLGFSSDMVISWSSTTGAAVPDVGIHRNSAGILNINNGSVAGGLGSLIVGNTSASTNTVLNGLTISTNVTGAGAGANGLGAGLLFSLETATASTMQSAGQIAAVWTDATNATRKAKLQLSAYDTAQRIGIEILADGVAGITRTIAAVEGVYTTTAINLTLTSAHHWVTVTAACTITLPACSGLTGREYIITATVDNVIVDGNSSETINSELTQTLSSGDTMQIKTDGVSWYVI